MHNDVTPDGPGQRQRTLTPCAPGQDDDIDCETALERVFEYIDSEMSLDDLQRWNAHLERCPHCDHEVGVERHLRQLLRRSCCETAPEQLRVRIVRQITVLRSTAS